MNFLEHKKWLRSHGYTELRNVGYYFVNTEDQSSEERPSSRPSRPSDAGSSNLKFFNLPRIALRGSDNKRIEDKCIKNMYSFDL